MKKIEAIVRPEKLDEIRKALLTINSQLSTDNCLIITMGAGDIYKVAEQIAD